MTEILGKIDTLSRKGQGQPKDADINSVVSEMKGDFHVSDGVVTFSNLNFGVVGALLNLSGTYNLGNGGLDFHGKLMLQAKLSQTTTGAKSFFLKALDAFFKGKNAGTVLQIKITGTKDNPAFGLDHERDSKKNESPPPKKGKLLFRGSCIETSEPSKAFGIVTSPTCLTSVPTGMLIAMNVPCTPSGLIRSER